MGKIVNNVETKIDRQVQLWALTGPMLALITSSIILFKAPAQARYLMFGLLIGLPACWWAKWRGLAISFGILAALFAYHYSGIPSNQKIWHVGMVLSLLICFAVTSLSLEEAESVQEAPESNPEQENKVLAMQRVQEEQLMEINQHKEFLDIARAEVISNQKEIESLKLENVQQRQAYAQLDEKHVQMARRYNDQQEAFSKSRQEMQYFQDRLQSMHGELQSARMDAQHAKAELLNSRRQNEEMVQELIKAKEISEGYAKAQEEQLVHEAMAQEMSEHIQTLSKEKDLVQSALNAVQNELSQVKADHVAFEAAAQSELQILQKEKDLAQSALSAVQNELNQVKAAQMALEATAQSEQQILHSEKVTLQNTLKQQQLAAQNDLQAVQAEKMALQIDLNKIQAELVEWRNKFQQSQEELKEKTALQAELDQLREQHKQRATDYADLNAQLVNLQNKADLLAVEKERSLQELQGLRSERDALAKEIQENGHSFEGISSEASAWRQAEAKYAQLQGQFAEKSAVLDKTRRELFITQERLLQLQREMEEAQTYAINDAEAALTQQLIQLDKQSKREVADYQKEIAALHEIISALMRNS